VVIDAEGRRLLSRRVANDEAVLLALISDVTGLRRRFRISDPVRLLLAGLTASGACPQLA